MENQLTYEQDTEAETLDALDPMFMFVARPTEVWVWRPDLKPPIRQQIVVLSCTYMGDEWWVKTRNNRGEEALNDLSHFLHSAVLIKPSKESR